MPSSRNLSTSNRSSSRSSRSSSRSSRSSTSSRIRNTPAPRRSLRQYRNRFNREYLQHAIQKGIDMEYIELLNPRDNINRVPISYLRRLGRDFLIHRHNIGNLSVVKPWIYNLSDRDLAMRIYHDLPNPPDLSLSPSLELPQDDWNPPTRTDELTEEIRRRMINGSASGTKHRHHKKRRKRSNNASKKKHKKSR